MDLGEVLGETVALERSSAAIRGWQMRRYLREELEKVAGGGCRRAGKSVMGVRVGRTCRKEKRGDSEGIRDRERPGVKERRRDVGRSKVRIEDKGRTRARGWRVSRQKGAVQKAQELRKT